MDAGATREHTARRIVARLRDAGFTAYFAGGYARDVLLGRAAQDIDIATDATAAQVQGLFARTVPIGAQFGVVLVIENGAPFEVATFRADLAYSDGRRPDGVRFTSPEEDAKRRDFTINGMFYDPTAERVIDFVHGRRDLAAGVVRAIGSPGERLHEDRLRMLRAVRFAARLGFTIEAETFAAIQRSAHMITSIAWERIGDEIVRILTEGGARRGFELLDTSGLLDHVLPEVAAMKGCEQTPDYHPEGDVFVHTLLLLEQLGAASETLALGALLHDVAKPRCAERKDGRITFYGHTTVGAEMAEEICQRLRRSRATWERVAHLVRGHLRPVEAPHMRASTLRRFLAEDGIEELLELVRMDALASSKDLTSYEFCRRKREELGAERIKPPPILKGRDLLELGFTPGPLIGQILQGLEELQLEGVLESREQALAWVLEHHARPS